MLKVNILLRKDQMLQIFVYAGREIKYLYLKVALIG